MKDEKACLQQLNEKLIQPLVESVDVIHAKLSFNLAAGKRIREESPSVRKSVDGPGPSPATPAAAIAVLQSNIRRAI